MAVFPLAVLALWLTSSRGAGVALAIGLCILIAASPDRSRQLVTVVLGAVGAVALIVVAGLLGDLTSGPEHSAMRADGDLMTAVAVPVAAATGLLAWWSEGRRPRLHLSRRLAMILGAVLLAGLAAGAVAADPGKRLNEFERPPSRPWRRRRGRGGPELQRALAVLGRGHRRLRVQSRRWSRGRRLRGLVGPPRPSRDLRPQPALPAPPAGLRARGAAGCCCSAASWPRSGSRRFDACEPGSRATWACWWRWSLRGRSAPPWTGPGRSPRCSGRSWSAPRSCSPRRALVRWRETATCSGSARSWRHGSRSSPAGSWCSPRSSSTGAGARQRTAGSPRRSTGPSRPTPSLRGPPSRYVQLTLLEQDSGNVDQALGLLKKAESHDSEDWRLPLIEASLQSQRGDKQALLAALARSRELSPKFVRALRAVQG